MTAIVGLNGPSKTTLLRAVTGDVGSDGVMPLEGADIKSMPAWHLAPDRAILPQASTLAFPFTVLEVVGMGCNVMYLSDLSPLGWLPLSGLGSTLMQTAIFSIFREGSNSAYLYLAQIAKTQSATLFSR